MNSNQYRIQIHNYHFSHDKLKNVNHLLRKMNLMKGEIKITKDIIQILLPTTHPFGTLSNIIMKIYLKKYLFPDSFILFLFANIKTQTRNFLTLLANTTNKNNFTFVYTLKLKAPIKIMSYMKIFINSHQ